MVLNEIKIERDLRLLNLTGSSIIIFSAGKGRYNVKYALSKLTKKRVLEMGLKINLITVRFPPFHRTPLFNF